MFQPGGLALRLRWHGDVEAFAARCLAHGLMVETARVHHVSGATLPFFRAGFPGLSHDAMQAVAERLVLARDG